MLSFDPRRAREDFAKSRRCWRGRAQGRIDPVDGFDFVAQTRFAGRPPGDERGDDEMSPNPVPSGMIASTCRLKAMISASTPTSSMSSRACGFEEIRRLVAPNGSLGRRP